MLKIGQVAVELTSPQEAGAGRRRGVKRQHDQMRVALRLGGTEAPDFISALVYEHVEAAVANAGFALTRPPGRLSIRAESATGVALQLVDMIAGPAITPKAGSLFHAE